MSASFTGFAGTTVAIAAAALMLTACASPPSSSPSAMGAAISTAARPGPTQDKPTSKATDKGTEKGTDKVGENAAEKTSEKAADKRAENSADKSAKAVKVTEPAAPASGLRPFAEVIKDARELPGFFTVWQKEDRIWIEVKPEQLEMPFFLGTSLASGLGERFFLPGLLGREQLVVLRRFHNQIQMIARNVNVRAPENTPLGRAVRESYSDSLLAASSAVSAPHLERKSFLVDGNALLFNDVAGLQTALESAFRLSYGYDRGNSTVEHVRNGEGATSITLRQHFSVPRLPAPPSMAPPPGATLPMPPQSLPDARSLFLNVTLNWLPLPEPAMRPRLADPRVGHFTRSFVDLGLVQGADARSHVVERWRLEKQDPAAEVSPARVPITVWMDRNIPEQHRVAVRAGILEWNKAFERAGLKDALLVKQQPEDADWSTIDGTRHIAVRWFAMEGPGAVAVGPSQSDPRTGEILNAAAIIPENWARIGRSTANEVVPRPPATSGLGGNDRMASEAGQAANASPWREADGGAGIEVKPFAVPFGNLDGGTTCRYASDAMEQAAFGLDLLEARGDLGTGQAAESERFIAASLKDVVMHEMGHALGLRHNFRASSTVALSSLRDPAYVHAHGVANSVMDYSPLNLPLEGEGPTEYHQTTLGAYDYFAIEYAYRVLPAESEREQLRVLAERSRREPALAYATDEDLAPAFGGGIDPRINLFDLGDDPLAFYARRFTLSRELWRRTQSRALNEGDSYALYRRNLARGLNQIASIAPLIAKYVGGVLTSRDVAGGGGPLLAPVAADKQRAALDLLARELFGSESFRFDPKFISKLGVDHLERANDGPNRPTTDYSLATNVLNIQRTALDALMSEATAVRLADAETLVADRGQLLTLSEVHQRLREAIWSELATGRNVDSFRRNLQREHARRLASVLVRPGSGAAADLRAVQRMVTMRLAADIGKALRSGRFSGTVQAHLTETQTLLEEALKATLVKSAV